MSAEDDNDEDVWPPEFKMSPRSPANRANLIAYARENWARNDDENSEIVHKLCDELEALTTAPITYQSQPQLVSIGQVHGFRYVLGVDHARTNSKGETIEDYAVVMILERQIGGQSTIVAMSHLDRRQSTVTDFYELMVKGWMCRACSVFNGEMKETLYTCRSCALSRPLELVK